MIHPSSPSVPRLGRWIVALAVVVALALGGYAYWRHETPPTPPRPASTEPHPDELVAKNPGYVGPQACVACHANRVADFQKTRHFVACVQAKPGIMPEGFAAGRGGLRSREPGIRFEMSQSGNDFLQTVLHATPAGEKRTTSRIDLVYGSGAGLDEVYFSWRDDGTMFELPMAWLHPQNRWGTSPVDPHGGGEFARETHPRCMECHNTWMEHVPGTTNQFNRHGMILGVTCENCHGPAREHVAQHQASPGATEGKAIVHPGRLPRERQMDLCAQCHSNSLLRRSPAFSYRPGEPLDAHFKSIAPKHAEEDHVANQTKYVRASKCFQKSATLTCNSCHNPHKPEGPANAGSTKRTCLKCHEPAACREQPKLPEAVRGDCIGCHMPTKYKIQVSFITEDDDYVPPVRIREHRVGVYPEARDTALLDWLRKQPDEPSKQRAATLKSSLAEHWRKRADQHRRDGRNLAAIGALREGLHVAESAELRDDLKRTLAEQTKVDRDLFDGLLQFRQQRMPQAIDTFNGLLKLRPDWAFVHGKLGTAYAVAGQKDKAAEHLRAVARFDADEPYGANMLGWLAYLDGRSEEAADWFRQADAIEPWTPMINYRWGLALSKLARWPEAAERFRTALKADPKHAAACQSLSVALLRQGKRDEALASAERAVRLTRAGNADMLLTLAECQADLGRYADAEASAAKALDAAIANNSTAVPAVRARRDEYRDRAKQAP